MDVTEWFLLIVVVILIPLTIAVVVTLWTLEQARQRSKKNRSGPVRRVALPTDEGDEGGEGGEEMRREDGKTGRR